MRWRKQIRPGRATPRRLRQEHTPWPLPGVRPSARCRAVGEALQPRGGVTPLRSAARTQGPRGDAELTRGCASQAPDSLRALAEQPGELEQRAEAALVARDQREAHGLQVSVSRKPEWIGLG